MFDAVLAKSVKRLCNKALTVWRRFFSVDEESRLELEMEGPIIVVGHLCSNISICAQT